MFDVQTIGVLVTAASVSVAAIYYAFTLRINMKNQELSLKALEQTAKAQELTLKTQQQNLETRQAQLYMYFAAQMTSDTWVEHMLRIRGARASTLFGGSRAYWALNAFPLPDNAVHRSRVHWRLSHS